MRDGVFDGKIQTGDGEGDYVLVVTLKDEAALEAYYRAPAHSSVRERFLSTVSPEIAALYAKAAANPGRSVEHYEEIERLAENSSSGSIYFYHSVGSKGGRMDDRNQPEEEHKRQESFEAITFSYLKRHYFDGAALRKRTMDEFVRAIRTGRLIAFTGSMTTEDRGYADWNTFVKECFKEADKHFKDHLSPAVEHVQHLKEIVQTFRRRGDDLDFRFDKRVSFSIIGETVDVAAQYSGKAHVNPNKNISKNLFLKRKPWTSGRNILDISYS